MSRIEAVAHVPEADSFQIQASLEVLRHAVMSHLWLVITTIFVTTGLVFAYVWIWPPTFEAEVIVAAHSEGDSQRNSFYQGWNVFRKDTLTDEAALMTSPPVLREVVRRLDLKYEEVYHPFTSYIVHLWGNSWVGQNYRKVKYWLFPRPPNPHEPSEEDIERYKVLRDFKAGVGVTQVGEANIGVLVVKGSTQRVSEIANTLIDVYLEQRRERFVNEARDAYRSLREEVDRTRAELDALDSEVKQFRSDNGLLLLFEKDRVQIGQWLELRSVVASLQASIAESENSLKVIDRQIAAEAKYVTSDRVFKDGARQERLTRLEAALAQARQLFQPDSREVREIEEQIAIAMGGIENGSSRVVVRNSQRVSESYEQLRAKKLAIESQLAGARAALTVKSAEAERLQALLDTIPAKMQLSREYERRQGFLEAKYSTLNEKLTMAAVSMATARSAPAAMRVVDYASPPDRPAWPKTKLMAAGAALLGALVGAIGALLLELLYVRVNRYRLWKRDEEYQLFAIVDYDEKFLARLYAATAGVKLLDDARAR